MDFHQAVNANHEHFDRVRQRTPNKINHKLDYKTQARIEKIKAKGTAAIQKRLEEIDREWDIDRVLMINFAVVMFAQLFLAAKKSKKWLIGPLIQTPFLFMHATFGWCPPSLWFRPIGFRTRKELQSERDVLLAAL